MSAHAGRAAMLKRQVFWVRGACSRAQSAPFSPSGAGRVLSGEVVFAFFLTLNFPKSAHFDEPESPR